MVLSQAINTIRAKRNILLSLSKRSNVFCSSTLRRDNLNRLPSLTLSTQANQVHNNGAQSNNRVISILNARNQNKNLQWEKLGLIAGASSLLLANQFFNKKDKAECCGIAGMVATKGEDAR